jgi:outer membrane protein OmpA-like peptidoglycan-associated protein
MKQKLLILILFFCLATAFSQSVLRKAERHFKDLAYTLAAKEYAEYLEDKKNPSSKTLLHAAESNFKIGNTAAAAQLYERAYILEGNTFANAYLHHYILSLRSEENYIKADELQLQHLKQIEDNTAIKQFTIQKQYLDSIRALPPKFAVTNISGNTALADFGTAYYGDKIVYTSAKDAMRDGGKKYSWNQQPYLVLYIANRDTVTGNFSNEKKFLQAAQTAYHNAAPAFSPDLKMVYATVNNVDKTRKLQNDKKGTNNVQLVYGEIKNGILASKTVAAFNSNTYSAGQPAVSPDGKWLYFVSDMPGGYGETDIYRVSILSNNKLGEPENLGPVINTAGKEMFPFIGNDVLYFSSDGHYGLGGLDVFASTIIKKNKFEQPINSGKPVNSNRDDFAFIIDNAGNTGYVSSNRAGGKGDDDIYYISLAKDIPLNTDEVPESITALDPNPLKSDSGLTPDSDLIVNEGGVQKIAINPIYFDFDKLNIREQAAAELDKVVYVLKKYPNMVIMIESHTDSRGSDRYNMELSANRAKSTYDYIVSKGINPLQIQSVIGLGETRLLNRCYNGAQCSEAEHQLNRRSDFIIVRNK